MHRRFMSILASSRIHIDLLPHEKEVFSCLLGCLHSIGRKDTVMRVAGGWVRDKVREEKVKQKWRIER